MTTAEPTKTPTKEPDPTEVVDLGEGKHWCPRCPLVRGDHEPGKRWMDLAEAERIVKLFKEME